MVITSKSLNFASIYDQVLELRIQREIRVQITMDTLKKIGKYKYAQRHCLGEGSFGKVYEGFDESGRRVAIKKIQQRMIATDPYLKQSLSTEIAIMKKLKHRNIVQLIDTVTTANSIYLVLQFCKDGDLKRYSMNKRFTEQQALEILNQLISGFSTIVKEGIIHRDLKPANVLVHDGIFKICDFGFAKYFGELNRMAKTCVGTPIYMSPQVLKQKPYTSKSDIWSLGVMYYEMLFGKIPFLGKSEDQIFKIITRGKLIIPKCSQQSYLFLKNTLVIDQEERWDWKTVFEHFGLRQVKQQKPTFYQNFFNLIKTDSSETQKKVIVQNQNNSFERNQIKNISYNQHNDRNGTRYGDTEESPQKDNFYQPKTKHNKMARNILALDDPQHGQWKPPQPIPQQLIRNQQPNLYFEKVYTPEQTQKARWLYNVSIKFMLKESFYNMKIPSFKHFLYSLTNFTFEEYLRQTNPLNLIKTNKLNRIVLEQEKELLSKLLQELEKIEPCSNLKSIASVISLEGQSVLSQEDYSIVEELKKFEV